MNKLKLLVIVLVLLATGYAYAYDDGDFQIWNTDTEELKVNKDTKIALEEEFRWGDNAGEFYYQHYDVGISYNLKEYLNIGVGYRQIYELKNRKFKEENSPYAVASLLWDLKGFKFEDRNRFEYRHFDYQAEAGRYRNKLTVKLPWKFTALDIQPYISDEVYLSIGGTNQFNQNRFGSGFGMNLTKNIKGDIYYMLVDVRSPGKWKETNVLGTKLKISF